MNNTGLEVERRVEVRKKSQNKGHYTDNNFIVFGKRVRSSTHICDYSCSKYVSNLTVKE